jgi:hypothetical protein
MFIEVWDDSVELLLPFSGMNEKGLWYSMYGTPYLEVKNSTDLPYYYDLSTYYLYHEGELMLYECETIEEALEHYDKYNHNHYTGFQTLMADGTGNSVINEGDIQIYKEGNFQVVTNFIQSHPELGQITNDAFERFDIVVNMLEDMTMPSVEYFRDICNATHKKSATSWTCHSIICDLSNQIMYVYYFGDYEKQVVIDLNEELKKGEHSLLLGSLFEPEGNKPPAKPETPTGNESGATGEVIDFKTAKTSDPDRDRISYMWDWGDGNQSLWDYLRTGFYVTSSYSWAESGTYEVRVKAMDQYGAESEWSDPLVITMPKNKSINDFNPWIIRLVQRFPILELLI